MDKNTNNGPHELHEYASAVTEAIEQLGVDGLSNMSITTAKDSVKLEVPEYPYDIMVWDCDRMIGGEVGESADFEYFQLTLSFDEGDEESYALYDIKREKLYDYYYNFPTWIWKVE